MSKHARWLAAAAIMVSCFGCGGNDDGDDPGSNGDDGAGDDDGRSSGEAPRVPTAEEINGALADAGVFFDEGGVTIGDSRVDLGPDGIRVDDASIVSVSDSSIVFGAGDASVTIRTDGTCAELLSCCESLTDEAQKTECTTAHNDLRIVPLGGGDFLCGQVVAGYCP